MHSQCAAIGADRGGEIEVSVLGIDLVEVAPAYDPAGVTSILAAQLLLNTLGFIGLTAIATLQVADRCLKTVPVHATDGQR